jgi:hypothetical protein
MHAETHHGLFVRILFTFNLTIKLSKTSPLFGAQRKLVATLRDSALNVLPCSRVRCAEGEQTISI